MSAKTIYDELLKSIKNPYGVCGLMGNLKAESGLKANNVQNSCEKRLGMNDEQYTKAVDDGSYSSSDFIHDKAGYGLAQWTFWSRKEKLLMYAKAYETSIGDESMQANFLIGELRSSYNRLFNELTNAKSVREASDAVLTQYERPADMSDAVKRKRASFGEEFYNEFCKEKPARSRNAVVELAKSWLGKNEADGSYKSIIDIYNNYGGPFPRGTKMNYGWKWCACTWSALAIKLGYTDIMPIEISCFYLIEKAKEMGIWQEDDSYIPKLGDAILYDWDDNSVGDNKGTPDHIGIVEKLEGNKITVIEGNCSNSVKRRIMSVNGRYIRGYIAPKYTDEVVEKQVEEVKVKKQMKAKSSASHKNKEIAGSYYTTTDLWMRDGAGTDKPKMVVIPKGTVCMCYGYYSVSDDTKWLYIVADISGTEYVGFSSEKRLRRK